MKPYLCWLLAASIGMMTALSVRSADDLEMAEAVTNAIVAAFPDCEMTAHPTKRPYWSWNVVSGANTMKLALDLVQNGESIQESGSMTGLVSLYAAGFPEHCRTNWSIGDGACSIDIPSQGEYLMYAWYTNVIISGISTNFGPLTNLISVAVAAVESVH